MPGAAQLLESHLARAGERLGDGLVHAAVLEGTRGRAAGCLVVGRRQASAEMRSVAAASPLAGGWWSSLAGADPSLFAAADPDAEAPAGFLELVLDPAEPSIPFDDPTVMGIMRQQQGWFFPLLGRRHISCGALIADGVRAAGAYVSFSADSEPEAEWLARQDPWRAAGRGYLLRHPGGVFAEASPPPGPGVQRMGTFLCGKPEPASEP